MKPTFFLRALCVLTLCVAGAARLHAAVESSQLDANENLFAVLAAINAAGYDEGINLPDSSPLRRQLREYVAKQDMSVLPDLRRFVERHRQKNSALELSQYVSFALSVQGPPEFGWKSRDVDVPPDALALTDFAPLLARFYRQANVAELWKQSQPIIDKELEKYHQPIIAMMNRVNGYLRVPADSYLGRRFRVFVDLLGAPQQIQTRNYGDDAFVVATPSVEPRIFDIRHAYLHYQIDPIVIKYGMDLQQRQNLLDYVQETPLDSGFKNDFVLLSNESLIKAVESRLDSNAAEVQQAASQGFALTPYFAEQLPAFEKQQQGMRFYMETLAALMDLKHETARIKAMKFDSAVAVRAARPVNVAAPEQNLSEAGKSLAKAEDLYTGRSLEDAKTLYLKSLEQKGSDEEHAQAWYGLARISVLQRQPENAQRLFEKTLAASPDPQTKAWSYVYLARLAKASSAPEEAEKFYQQALAVEGASKAAVQAAQTEIKTIQK